MLILALVAAGCAAPGGPATDGVPEQGDSATRAESDAGRRLADWLTGRFEAAPEPRSGTRASRHMLASPILADEPGRWIYVVQWQPGEGGPERQFVYHVQPGAGSGQVLDIYTVLRDIDNPLEPTAAELADIRQGCLERRVGCRMRLSQDGLSFVGGTRGRDCPADYRGAERLRVELAVREDEVREWLQGYDGNGQRLWSAEEGGRTWRRVDSGD